MKPLRGLILGAALVALVASAETASAAWNNVFQVTFFHKKPATAHYYAVPVVVPAAPPIAAYSSPCCDPCPKTNCTTNYVQRCYYQPVTVMQTKTYYEPVTTVQTSYYYAPVVSYKYSCYYDPCSCSYQQVAVPMTSYCLKAKCCPVQSWVQKCCQVPITTYQKAFYWEPQTTCCTTTPGAPIFAAPPSGPPQGLPTGPPQGPPTGPPQGPPTGPPQGPPTGPPPVNDYKGPAGPSPTDKFYGPPTDKPYGPPPVSEGSQTKSNGAPYNGNWQGIGPALGNPVPAAKPSGQPPAGPKAPVPFDKIASLPGHSASPIKGQVVSSSNAPKPHTQLVFVHASQKGSSKTVTANAAGQFNVALTSGQWNVYIEDAAGQPKYHSKIQIAEQQPSYLTLVSK